ncbi:hypothetical protein [Paenibacillus sp. Soil787]|uniref:hypothetical protein n=1 Tax=Paenibacillus sp. Soil787 TaxID=1736411 RepID=UPI0007032EF3|nr:hypothetical protein [Paenibacillus sp. Soil787]KRF21738.1 hypothetical protein ASG93_30570 [Paenibacillus sp. Soil787]
MSRLTLEQQLLIMSATIRLTEKNCALGKMRLSDPKKLGTTAEDFFRKAASAERSTVFLMQKNLKLILKVSYVPLLVIG